MEINKKNLRDIDNWDGAPIPVCMGGDKRALTWCCKPGYSLSYGFKCLRDEVLEECELSAKDFTEIKEKFSKENDWDAKETCFGSLSYCCMRSSGCFRRDTALARVYPGKTYEEVRALYYKKKKELSDIIMEKIHF